MQPESRYINKVHKLLPASIFTQSMRGMFTNGTPDRYYEGDKNNLWVEYKWLARIPRKPYFPATTPLQRAWCNRAHANSRQVAVIVGCPSGGQIILDGRWNDDVEPHFIENKLVADWIVQVCLYQ